MIWNKKKKDKKDVVVCTGILVQMNMFVLIGKIDLKLRKKMVKDEFYNNLNLKIIKIYGKLIKNIWFFIKLSFI